MGTPAKQKLIRHNGSGITDPRAANADRFYMDPLCDNTLYRIDNTGRKVLAVRNHHFEIVDPYADPAQKKAEERARNGGLTDAEMNRARFYCAANEEMVLESLAPVRIVVPAGHQAGEVRRGTDGKAYMAVYGPNGKLAYYDDGFSCVRPDAAVLGASIATVSGAGLTPSLHATVGNSLSSTGLQAIIGDVTTNASAGFTTTAPEIKASVAPTAAFGGVGLDAKPVTFSPNTPRPPAFSANAPRFELSA